MRPFSLLIKPAGPDCPWACRYCFYRGKTSLFGPGPHRMDGLTAETLVRDFMRLEFPVHGFAWQGGEPTLMGLDFFRQVIEWQKKYGRRGQVVSNALQTNGMFLDEAWCRFLTEYKFLVGISLDGPKPWHDHYRRDAADRGTFDRVMDAVACCRAHGVAVNILTLLNDQNVIYPGELFDFMVNLRVEYVQFIPCLEWEARTGKPAAYAITPEQYGNFLCHIFDRWRDYGPEKIHIRDFDSLLHYHLTGRPTVCTFGPRCLDYLLIEHDGGAYCCDFFAEPLWRVGNILDTPIEQLLLHPIKQRFARAKHHIANACFVCRHRELCWGGCLKDRRGLDENYRRPSYFCPAYRRFFDHAREGLRQMAERHR